MAFLQWRDELDSGISVIDDQHRRIVDMINQLHQAQLRADAGVVATVIEELVDYTLSHFAFEESMMEEAGYAFTRAHKRVHELFIRRVGEYRERFARGEDVADELKSLLGRWLFNHILNDDRDYVGAVRENLTRLAAESNWLRRATKRFFLRTA